MVENPDPWVLSGRSGLAPTLHPSDPNAWHRCPHLGVAGAPGLPGLPGLSGLFGLSGVLGRPGLPGAAPGWGRAGGDGIGRGCRPGGGIPHFHPRRSAFRPARGRHHRPRSPPARGPCPRGVHGPDPGAGGAGGTPLLPGPSPTPLLHAPLRAPVRAPRLDHRPRREGLPLRRGGG
ncbi:MAG: hypothetical protein EA421_04190 [Gemmatimonadales bacterium]|nr:MAG: hypothetical protein EA421_04190 [Gemmatimonadales bacterium]